MFALFGTAGNPGAAIPRINAYYGQLLPADFPPAPSTTKGRDTPVHQQRLDRAAALLTAKGQTAALKFGGIGGFSIRNNVNNQNLLSNHSFGWAVDLDPELNPNIAKANLPLTVIQGLTGLDLYGPVSEALRTPRPFDTCLTNCARVADASAALVDAFRTMANLKVAAGSAIGRATGVTLAAATLDAAFAAAGQSEAGVRAASSPAAFPPRRARPAG
jgi:hypothetical protein